MAPEPEPVLEIIEPVAQPEPEPVVELTSVQVTEVIPLDVGEESQIEEEPITKEITAHKKSRAPMPSWDEIVRGTQTDEGESF
jgi:hypothetical protein